MVAAALGALGLATGCNGELPLPGAGMVSDGGAAEECQGSARRACGHTLGAHGEVLTCYEGTQRCEGGRWSVCSDGKVLNFKNSPKGPGLTTQSLSSPVTCQNDPCDPTCRVFNEAPDGGWSSNSSGTPLYTWTGGTLSQYPSGLVKKGLKEPCQSGADCQFDQQCTAVSTGLSCGHDKCTTGAALLSACDSCVAQICAVDSSCCGDSTCAHDVCTTGVKLDSACNSCATQVCAAHAECCASTWDDQCVGYAQTICNTCKCAAGETFDNGHCYVLASTAKRFSKARIDCTSRGQKWDLAEIDTASENAFLQGLVGAGNDGWIGINDQSDTGNWIWANGDPATYTSWAGQPDNGHGSNEDCAWLDGLTGSWSDDSCSTSRRYFCEGPVGASSYSCGTGQTLNGSHCYKALSSATWATGVTSCQALGTGWNLVAIGDAAEDTFVNTLTTNGYTYWIGANDQSPSPGEGNWSWSGGAALTYSNWAGQPDGGNSENCALLSAADGTWSDADCSAKHYAACEGPQTTGCPSGWTASGSKCFQVVNSTVKWSSAEAACITQGGHLASAASAAENATLLGLTTGGSLYWFGYTDAAVEGTWAWSDSAPSTYTNWSGEPNGGASENCAMVATADGAWSDQACGDRHGTVCEGPQSTTCPSGWTILGSRCVKAYASADTWTNAEAFCVAQGGHLASVANSTENTTVLGLTSGSSLYWLGYGDSATEGTFVSQDGSALTYTNWSSEPDSATTACAMVSRSDGKWSDESCSDTKNYVCEGAVTNACPSGWTTSGSKCFQAQSSSVNFATAEADCAALGANAHLATIASAGENATVEGLAGSGTYWIGYTDAAVEGTWMWKDGSAATYTSWIPSQPDATGTNCATLGTDGFWYDDACTTTQKYACENAAPASCSGSGLISSGGHCYKFSGNKKFDDAETACVALGANWHLMTVNDATENALALANMGGKGWIGYTNQSGSWAWQNGTSTYTHWYVYPDGGSAANCASINMSTGQWDDNDCATAQKYVCQMPVPACPTGTVSNNGECYQFGTTNKSWSTAQTACKAIATGYDLATVSDSTEDAYIKSQIGADSWIGFKDAVVGTWTWSTGTSTYTNWRTQPDGGTAQNCVAIDDATGKWSDEACSGARGFVCEVTPLVCATGTTLHDGNCYKFDSTTRTWSGARSSCQAIGTGYDLVTVDDSTENTWLVSQASGDFWAGASDSVTEGTWAWVSGTSTYTNWRIGPDGGTSENCAALNDATGLWEDHSCGTSYRYICERSIPSCATGTSLHGGACYALSSSTKTFATAQSDCKALGTGFDLATVSDTTENAWLTSQLPGDAWIGYTDSAAEGTWTWSAGTSTYTNWTTEPNGGTSENCAALSDTTGKWSDAACSTSYRVVCEGPATVSASASCGSGEVSNNGECYYYGTSGKAWSAAETACESRGTGYALVTVSSQAENDFIKSTIGSSRNVWIGYSDSAVEGTFEWASDDGTSFTAWQSDPNDDPTQECGRLLGSDGSWTSEDCATSKKAVCEGPASTVTGSGGTWTQACVDKVGSVCDATCNTSSAAGTCTPWLPGQKEPYCSTGVDLALGAACEGEKVPVCNHGGIDAPAGVTLAWFPANSTQYPKCNPDLSKRKDSNDCVVNEPIPAGKCVTITCPNMTNSAEIMVNPPGPAHVSECSCQDNWSLYDKNAACGAPDCSGGVSQASLRKVNMYVIVDRSSSMSSNGKWDGARAALQDFFGSPQSAGIGVALEFFPLSAGVVGDASGDGCGMDIGTCSPSRCANPYVPLGTLTSDPAPTDAQEAALIAPLKQANWLQNSTPSWPALVGSLNWATARQQSVPNENHIVVFVTDGQPYGSCINGTAQNTNDQLAIQASDAYTTYGVRTYTIGMIGANNAALDKIADAGGTGQAFVVDGTDPTQVASQLSSALQAIAGQNVSCDFTLPNQGLFDPNSATVTYTSGSGTTTTLDKQANAAACGTGWYFDDPANPTTATLCPDSCTTAKQDTNARVEIHLGCPSYKGNGVFRQTYEAKCNVEQEPQWGFLAWDAIQPANTAIAFKIRVAQTLAGLSTATFVGVGAVPSDPAVCAIGGPAPCPKDMYPALGVPGVHYPYLELEVDTTAYQSSAPTVNDFKITYSCTDNQ